ncbi:DUF4268 domain-containing protein [Marinifilum fragile]|jgi:hypothetical protein|uniref:DUF4268 domain-containing protein n=1 Tax=Marinifilum fragile TaxID=570161 RepID=UPI0006CF3581|nr:DUF4268 domain-containing protein [Marinifilum fragile]
MYTKEEKREFRIQFWDGFKRYSKKQGRKMTSWVLKGTQIKEAQLKFDLNDDGAFVMLQIDSKFDVKRYSVFDKFLKYRPVVEDTCGGDLIWDKNYFIEGFKEVSVIYFQLREASVYKKENWEEYYQFLFQKMCLLEEAFLDIKEVVQND